MTTATQEKPAATEASASIFSPGELESAFYPSTEKPATTDPPKPAASESQSHAETGHSATPEKASADSAAKDDKGEQPKGSAEDKQEESQRAAAARLGKEVKELKAWKDEQEAKFAALEQEKVILQQKLDGTYKEPAQPTPEQIAAKAKFDARESVSRPMAEQEFGVDEVKSAIYSKNSTYEQLIAKKPWVQIQVMRSELPTIEAMRILEQEKFVEKYGTDPRKWVEKISAELEPKFLEKFKQQTATQPTGKEAPTVTESRGSSGGPDKTVPMESLFYK